MLVARGRLGDLNFLNWMKMACEKVPPVRAEKPKQEPNLKFFCKKHQPKESLHLLLTPLRRETIR